MDWLSFVLMGVVIFYVTVLSIKNLKSLQSYKKVKNELEKINGKVVEITKIEMRKNNDNNVIIGYPVYECVIGKIKKKMNSDVCYRDLKIGTEVTILYDKETGELRCQEDLSLMKKQIVIRVIMALILLLILIIESILL